jgi:hypothetical protein
MGYETAVSEKTGRRPFVSEINGWIAATLRGLPRSGPLHANRHKTLRAQIMIMFNDLLTITARGRSHEK